MKNLQYLIYITLCTSLLFLFFANPLAAQEKGNFELAERFTSDNMSKLIGSTSLSVNWIEDSNRLWYEWEDPSGNRWMFADAGQRTIRPLFDHDEMASQLSEIFERGFNRKDLELQDFDYDTDREMFTFHVDSIEFTYNVDRRELIKGDTLSKEEDEPWATYSPDSTWIAFAREHDLYLMEADDPDSTEYRLTEDGERWYSYQADHGDTTTTERLRSRAQWFEDSKKLYVKRQDWREVDELWVIDMLAERPELETYKYNMPGDENHYRDELIVFDAESHESVLLDVEKWPDQSIGGAYFNHGGGIYTSEESDYLWFLRRNRTWDTIDVCKADTETGEVEVLWSETYQPYIDAFNVQLSVINEGEEYIWWSERTGWGQLYRYDSEGKFGNRITDGHYMVSTIAAIDTTDQIIYYQGYGKEEGTKPDYPHYYRIGFDGNGFQHLTPEDAHHTFSMSDTHEYFVDTFSRVDLAPKAVIRNTGGEVIMELEGTDLSPAFEQGWEMPETFTVKAADGKTDLYGVIWKPADFDPDKKYPVISFVYPGPFTEPFPTSFSVTGSAGRANALSQVGFVVVSFGQRGGSPLRDSHYHKYGHGNLRDYPLPDNKHGIEQLGARRDYIDLGRVGIYGHSGGGFMSTAALLTYPDFYKVAVSSNGNHDNNIYNIWWSEIHHGVEEKTRTVTRESEDGEEEEIEETYFESTIPSNADLAGNLKGRLLLVIGERDNNVHPANTYRLAEELLKKGKRFDLMVFPGARHGFGRYSAYFERLLWDYFAEHLLGDYRTNIDFNLPED